MQRELGVSPQYVVLVLDHLEEVGAGETAEELTEERARIDFLIADLTTSRAILEVG
ncbi:hypothetical protein ACI2LF_28080 [Kribbella sp. NPDC020789]